MALFPQGLSQIDARCNAGERRVLHQLKRCLCDDFLVWHNTPLGPRAREPDFVIQSPRRGILLLEVKDWKRSTLAEANRDTVVLSTERGRVTEANPLRQARDYALELANQMQADPALVHQDGPFQGKLLFPYGWGVVFAKITQAEVAGSDFDSIFPSEKVLLRDDLDERLAPEAFLNRLWGMFTVSYPYTLTLPQRDRIRWHLFPEIRMPAQAGLDFDATPATLPDVLAVMDLQQEQLARSLGEGHRVIHGAAGSGKTMILIYCAQALMAAARADWPILVLCYNRSLADRIGALLAARGVDERVQVRTFHSWCQDMARSYQLDVPSGLQGDAYYPALVAAVQRGLATQRVPGGQYVAILIDEAHDFEDAWLRMASQMVDPRTRSLLVLYDDAQSIYQKQRRKFNFASVGIEAQGRTSILKLNYRNTTEVLNLALHCAEALLRESGGEEGRIQRVQPASAGRSGPQPLLLLHAGLQAEAEALATRLEQAIGAGRAPEDIAVLARSRQLLAPLQQALRKRKLPVQSMCSSPIHLFDWRTPSIKLLTLHSARGLEFPLVCVVGLQAMPMGGESLEQAAQLLYVGMTRSTHELWLSAAGTSALVQRIQPGLAT